MTSIRAILSGMILIAFCFAVRIGRADESTAKTPPAPASPVERLRVIVEGLKLTDDQKVKSGVLFDAAREEMQKLDAKADPAVLKQKTKVIFDKLRKDIGEVLTNEQKLEVIKKMMPPGPTAIIDNIKAQLSKPEAKLTEEQKQKAFEVLDDARKKLEEIRTAALNGGEKDTTAKMNAVLQDMKVKLSKVLAPKDGAAK